MTRAVLVLSQAKREETFCILEESICIYSTITSATLRQQIVWKSCEHLFFVFKQWKIDKILVREYNTSVIINMFLLRCRLARADFFIKNQTIKYVRPKSTQNSSRRP